MTLYSLQIGRALAALAVVFSHSIAATDRFLADVPPFFYTLFKLGYLGVDYFFVLSGFIICYSTRQMQACAEDAWRYAKSRCLRIYVPYLPISLAMITVLTLFPALSAGDREGIHLLESLLLVPGNGEPALTVAWTLQHERVFYVLFGIGLFWLKRRTWIYLWALPIAALALFDVPRWLVILAGTINLEFLFGVTACLLYQQERFIAARRWFLAAGIAILCGYAAVVLHVGDVYLCLLYTSDAADDLTRLLLVGSPFLILYYHAALVTLCSHLTLLPLCYLHLLLPVCVQTHAAT